MSRRISRRDALRLAARSGALVAGAALLSDCGIPGARARLGPPVDWSAYWASQRPTRQLNFANWPLYIDSEHGKSQSLSLFTKATGIAVDYEPVIQGVDSFYATIEPLLAAREATGYDLMVITNSFQLTQLIENEFLVELDHSLMENFFTYASPLVRNPPYDPGNTYTATWQSGFTGIAYNTQYIDREIDSFEDLKDPAFRGRVGMMNDIVDLGSAGLLAIGVAPEDSTPADWSRAAEWLREQRPLVSGYYDQSYINHLENGDTWISQAWSGDVFQANLSGFPHLKYVTPKEGQVVWHDNMVIPRQAANPLSAMAWIDFYYQPSIAGIVEDWVNYVCPVPDARRYILDVLDDPTVADSPLVFPPASENAVSHSYKVFSTFDEYELWVSTFNPIIES